jgi:nucleotide-binding universal stress UspA family protein
MLHAMPRSSTVEPSSTPGSGTASAVGTTIAGRTRRILLATDLSPASEEAVDAAIRLAMERDAQLLVMSVVDPRRIRLPGGPFLRRIDQERARVEAATQAIVARARTAGARATFLVWEGEPAPSILDAASSESADVIVLGSHGRGRLGRLILGSTSARVCDQARCEVLVVPASQGPDNRAPSSPPG